MSRFREFYRAEVVATSRLCPSLARVRLGGEDLRRFVGSGHPDEKVSVVFPRPGQAAPDPPEVRNGIRGYHRPDTRPAWRSYTVRRFDPDTGLLDIDFVLHGGGLGARWAAGAQIGDQVGLSAAHGWYAPPPDTAWQLLVADLPALPALARIVESLPARTTAYAVVEVPDRAHRLELTSPAALDVRWICGSGHGRRASALPAAVRAFTAPPQPGYVWCATEASVARDVRTHLRREWELPQARMQVKGYWRVDKEDWMARYRAVAPQLESVRTDALRSGLSLGEAQDRYDAALTEAGL